MLSSVLLGLTAVHCLIHPPQSPRPRRFFDDERVLVVAHRGGMRLGPEHTIWTFQRAVALGVDVIEMDLREAGDGSLVVIHDETVDRTTDGRGKVAALTLNELAALDAGHGWSADGGRTFPLRGKGMKIPRLEEVFASFPRTPFVLEIKELGSRAAAAVCETIRRLDAAERVLVAAFRSAPLAAFRSACPEVATAATVREVQRVWLLQRLFLPALYRPPADAFLIPERFGGLGVLDAAFVKRARDHDMPVHVWTVNEPADVERLAALGVRGFITDDPERVLAALGRSRPVAAGANQ
ncbi:MAG: glycerophosphodiester phosphodiesterase [Candidatus Binatia bacterium]